MKNESNKKTIEKQPHEVRSTELLAEAVAILRECEQTWGCECPYCDRDFGNDFESHAAACRIRRFFDAVNAVLTIE